jgi:hypothetical protein
MTRGSGPKAADGFSVTKQTAVTEMASVSASTKAIRCRENIGSLLQKREAEESVRRSYVYGNRE